MSICKACQQHSRCVLIVHKTLLSTAGCEGFCMIQAAGNQGTAQNTTVICIRIKRVRSAGAAEEETLDACTESSIPAVELGSESHVCGLKLCQPSFVTTPTILHITL